MAEFKFSCPGCGQHIQCNEQWSGQTIACPVCNASVTVPFLQSPPVAASSPSAPLPQRALVPKKKEPFPVKKVVAWTVGAAVGVAALGLVLHWADSMQVKLDEKSKQIAANSSGGEMTHIANLYQVLDATDPAKMEQRQMKARARGEKEMQELMDSMKPQPDPTLTLPLATPQWQIDSSPPEIPGGRVHGSISSQEFTPDTVTLMPNGLGRVLAFQQGAGGAADHEMFVYLPIGPNENIAGHSWTVTKDTKGKDAEQIVKRWTANPKFAPISKTYSYGYTMRLEFGEATRDWQPGKIYLALPDTNQTVLAGSFSIPIPHPEAKLDFRQP